MRLRLALNKISARQRFAAFILLALLLLGRPVLAHEGHDHGGAPEPVATALARAEAHSDLFEIVAILQSGGALTIALDRYADNSPLDGSVTLALDGQ